MARSRDLRPELFYDEKLADLPIEATVLFEAMWCYADLRGVFECSPRILKSQAFPLREAITVADVQGWRDGLEQSGIILMLASGQPKDGPPKYGFIKNWLKHQHISTREVEIGTDRPAPDEFIDPPRWGEIECKVEKARIVGGHNSKGLQPGRPKAGTRLAPGQRQDATAAPAPAVSTAAAIRGGGSLVNPRVPRAKPPPNTPPETPPPGLFDPSFFEEQP